MSNRIPIADILAARKFQLSTEPPVEDKVFRIEFQTVGSLGDYILITGRPKAGKTKYLSGAMAAAITRTETFGMNIKLPDHKRRVAHFDTEQGKRSHFNCLKLTSALAKLDNLPDHFDSYHCRQDSAATIISMINYYLETYRDTGIVFLDGLLDLIDSFNDETHSKSLVNWLKRITESHNALFIAILHRSMGVNKSIGHLGSSADRAAQSVLIVEKNKEARQFVLRSEYLRDADDFTPIAIHYNKQLEIWEQTIYIDPEAPVQAASNGSAVTAGSAYLGSRSKKRPLEYSHNDHAARINALFSLGTVQTGEELLQRIQEVYGTGRQWAVDCRIVLEAENLIWRVPEGYTNIQQGKLIVKGM